VIDAHEARTATLISSEKLNHSDVWKEIPQNYAVYIDENLEVYKYNLDK
jgi:predicted glutamine amidotransferase